MKLLMLKGLPASGKTSFAKELVKKGWVRTNKDEIRQLLHGGKWSQNNEKEVVTVRDLIVSDALSRGRDVVVDDTNFHPSHENKLRALATEFKAEFETKFFECDVDVCIERDLKREESVGEKVIRKMWRENIVPAQERPMSSNPPAVIFDIDGTLAIKGDRSPYEWEKVGFDTLNQDIAILLVMFTSRGYKILIFSGRDSICKKETEQWLYRYSVHYDELHMRSEGDKRKDVEVKKEFYLQCVPKYDIQYAVDDRLQVCRLWHELGVCLLKVGDPDIEF